MLSLFLVETGRGDPGLWGKVAVFAHGLWSIPTASGVYECLCIVPGSARHFSVRASLSALDDLHHLSVSPAEVSLRWGIGIWLSSAFAHSLSDRYPLSVNRFVLGRETGGSKRRNFSIGANGRADRLA